MEEEEGEDEGDDDHHSLFSVNSFALDGPLRTAGIVGCYGTIIIAPHDVRGGDRR